MSDVDMLNEKETRKLALNLARRDGPGDLGRESRTTPEAGVRVAEELLSEFDKKYFKR